MPKDKESIIDKFNEQSKATEEKPEKQVDEEVKPTDEETKAVDEQATADKPVEKSADSKEDSEKETKPKDKKDKDTDKDTDKDKDTKDKEDDEKSDKSKEDTKSKEETKSEVKKSDEVAENSETAESKDDVVKEDKVEPTIDKHLSDGEELKDIVTKSFADLSSRQDSLESTLTNKVDTVTKAVQELNDEVLPLLKKAVSYFSDEEKAVMPEVEDSPNPEETAIKSAKLEAKQEAEQIKKSADTGKEDVIAKDESSKVIDDVIEKSEADEEAETVAKSAVVETQVEKPKAFNVSDLDDNALRLTALGAVTPFFNRMTKDRRTGAITSDEVTRYQGMITDVQSNNTTRAELEQFIDYARGN